MSNTTELLKNLTLNFSLSVSSVEDGFQKLQGKQENLEVIHIYIENLTDDVWFE